MKTILPVLVFSLIALQTASGFACGKPKPDVPTPPPSTKEDPFDLLPPANYTKADSEYSLWKLAKGDVIIIKRGFYLEGNDSSVSLSEKCAVTFYRGEAGRLYVKPREATVTTGSSGTGEWVNDKLQTMKVTTKVYAENSPLQRIVCQDTGPRVNFIEGGSQVPRVKDLGPEVEVWLGPYKTE